MGEEVSLIGKRTVVSTKAAEQGRTIPLSVLDRVMESHHIKVVYYYATPRDDHGQVYLRPGELTNKLRIAMSEMLLYFPTVTGRLIKDDKGQWVIKCNDSGVRMVEAKAKGSVDSWLANIDDEKEKMLIHWEDMFDLTYFWSTFYVKITEFEEGGLAVGLSCTHLLADPLSAALFIKAWADRTLWGKMIVPPLFHSLPQHRLCHNDSQYQPNTTLIDRYKTIFESPGPSKVQKSRTIALAFTDQMVQACMKLAQLNEQSNGPNPSPFSSLLGIIWACVSRVKGRTNGLVDMSIWFDVRELLGLHKGYFGNCMIYKKVHGDGIGVDDPSQATRVIAEAITVGTDDKEATMELIKWLEHCEFCSPSPSLDNGDLIAINLENMDPYSSIFVENYEPIRVSYYIEPIVDKGKILVLPSRPCEGQLSRVVMVTLPNDELVKLCEDKLLARFSPTILMGVKSNS